MLAINATSFIFILFSHIFISYILLGDTVLVAPSILTATKLLLESDLLKAMKTQL